jgi:hypothetical protein
MTISEASRPTTRPMSGGKKAVLIFAAGCGGLLMLLLATCGLSVGIGMVKAILPPQVEVTYRGGNSEYMQLYAKNTSGRPLTDMVVRARWRNLASARAELRGTIAPGEERSFDLRAQIDESKLQSHVRPTDAYTQEEWILMTSEQQSVAIMRLAKINEANDRANNFMLDEAFSKPPTIEVTSVSGSARRSSTARSREISGSSCGAGDGGG